MRFAAWLASVVLLACPIRAVHARDAKRSESLVAVTIETTLTTAKTQVRQFAFDGDLESYFASTQNPGRSDHFTITFDKPVRVNSLTVMTGLPRGSDRLDRGALEASTDGKSFSRVAMFVDGRASAELKALKLRAVRIRPTVDLNHPLAIREFVVISEPSLAEFRYPVEFVVDADDAPEMKKWAEKVARVCERQYQMIGEELKSDGFKPRHLVTMKLDKNNRGVAAASGGHISGSVSYFKQHPDDIGAMVHETVHVVQDYRGQENPGYLVEGIADYIRFFKYEPGSIGPLDREQSRYDGSYRQTAAFLAYITEKYDQAFVRRLNAMMRQGKYQPEIFKARTGKNLQELGAEWKASLKP